MLTIGNAEADMLSAPGSFDNVIIKIPKGSRVKILGRQHYYVSLKVFEFYKVEYEGKTGWVQGIMFEEVAHLRPFKNCATFCY